MKRLACSLSLALAALASVHSAMAAVAVAPDNNNLQYTGRIDFTERAAPVITWPGTSIAGNFTGHSFAVKLDDQNGRNYFNVFLDGDTGHPFVIQADKGSRTYLVTSTLPAGKHGFLITKRTEGQEGATVFRGLELDDGGQLLQPPLRPERRIEFYGDSITSGMGNESPDNGRDDLAKDKNNFMSYASITARNLNAEEHVISQSGIGVMIGFPKFTMPEFYDQLSAVGKNDTKWDFSKWTPDVVVINLMQNDSWFINDHKMQPEPDDAQRIEAYKKFVRRIRQVYPNAYIVCSLGSMSATRPGSPWPGYVSSAVEKMRTEDHDQRIGALFFEFTGYTQHPRIKQHQANAARLTAFIREKLGW